MADKAWKKFERDIAALFGTTRRLMKGTKEKSDIGDDSFPIMVDCKLRKKESWSIGGWLRSVEQAAIQTGQYPVLVLREPGKIRRYAVVSRTPFIQFITQRTSFGEEHFYTWNGSITPKVPYLTQWSRMLKKLGEDKSKSKVANDAMPMLFIHSKRSGDIVLLKPEDLVRIFKDGGLLDEQDRHQS